MLCKIYLNKPDFKSKRTELSAGGKGASLTPAQVSRRPGAHPCSVVTDVGPCRLGHALDTMIRCCRLGV